MHTVPPEYADRIHVDQHGCWLWTAGLDSHGYAQARVNGRTRLMHRVIHEILVGVIPDHLEPDHTCRVRRCVNPKHLDLVTHRENVLRGEGVAAHAALATHCPAGHPYDGRNLVIFADGKRRCRVCRNERDKDWKKRSRRKQADHGDRLVGGGSSGV